MTYASRERNGSWKNDLFIGKRLGRWTIIEAAAGYTKNRQSRWLCKCECGKEKIVASSALRTGKSVSCGCFRIEQTSKRHKELPASKHPKWNGGKSKTKSGYISVHLATFYPDVVQYYPKSSCKLEHIAVMCRKLRRKLLPDETVHHKNGIRDDNGEDNLELRVRAKHPSGASVTDLLTWAHELIERYEHDY